MNHSPLRPPTRPVALGALLAGARNEGDATSGPDVSGITMDSRLVRPGDLYVALPGSRAHGAQFAGSAVGAGAVAVLTDAEGAALATEVSVPVVVVEDPRLTMARTAARLYDAPSEAMTMLAVTGTNGKTTTSFLLEAALLTAEHRPGVIGTIGFRLGGRPLKADRTTITTPESPELQALLATMRDSGGDAVVMEVSSHALVLGRVDGIIFDVAAFTNFGRDHLDFHGTEDAYFEAKAALFTAARTRRAVINIDDPRGRQIAERVLAAGDVSLTTTSLHAVGADFHPRELTTQTDGSSRLVLATPSGDLEVAVGLPGDFNVHNAITALAMLSAVGVDLSQALPGLAAAQVPGRMQRIDLGPGAPTVVVDFAHTPQAVGSALAALVGRRRIAVLGAGGDRDPEKRGPMGAAAVRAADLVIVTDDNPRTEEPSTIRAAVVAGATAAIAADRPQAEVIDGSDRRSAIRLALERAGADDVVAVLGKGHEEGQEIGRTIHPFNDADVIVEEWQPVRGSRP